MRRVIVTPAAEAAMRSASNEYPRLRTWVEGWAWQLAREELPVGPPFGISVTDGDPMFFLITTPGKASYGVPAMALA